jgi:hypothetical protein
VDISYKIQGLGAHEIQGLEAYFLVTRERQWHDVRTALVFRECRVRRAGAEWRE